MRKLIKFFWEIFSGVDMTVAILVFTITSVIFKSGFNWTVLLCAVVLSHLPDADMIPYVFLKRLFNVKFRIPSHRVIGHHPLFLYPVVMVLILWLGGEMRSQLLVVAILCLTAHFIHDSVEPQGFHWLSPFSWKRTRIEWLGVSRVPTRIWARIHLEKGRTYNKTTGAEFFDRVDPSNHLQKVVWAFSVFALFFFYLTSVF